MARKMSRKRKEVLEYFQHWLIAISAGAFVAAITQLGFINSYSVAKMQAWGVLLGIGFFALFGSLFMKAYQLLLDDEDTPCKGLDKSQNNSNIENKKSTNRR